MKNSARKAARKGQAEGLHCDLEGQGRKATRHLRKSKEARVPGAGGGQEGSRGQIERAFFGFCSERDGSHWRILSGGEDLVGRWGIDHGSQNKSRQSSQEAGTGGSEGSNEKLCVEGKANEVC